MKPNWCRLFVAPALLVAASGYAVPALAHGQHVGGGSGGHAAGFSAAHAGGSGGGHYAGVRGGYGGGYYGGWHGGGWRGGGWGYGGWGWGLGVGLIGLDLALESQYFGPYGYYPYYGYPVETYPAYQPAPVMPPAAAAQPAGTWYYCDSAKAYYPYVQRCTEPWRAVPAAPPGR